ncbi:MAG: chromosomal replication initiator protein DnaA, partial [Rhodobacteraceae bacterium]|nr:chromosomal replication initiator protein DnaA [Paracoccaceae bacterium]
MNNDLWGQIQEELQETIGKNNFTNWISPLKFSEVVDGVATFKVPTTFLGNYVSQNFGDIILFKLNSVDKGITRISFKVSDTVSPKKSEAKNELKVAKSAVNRSEVIPGAPLDPRFTFDSFIVGKPNELAHAAARRVADGTSVTFNPLFL